MPIRTTAAALALGLAITLGAAPVAAEGNAGA